jgi:hypothetical protein
LSSELSELNGPVAAMEYSARYTSDPVCDAQSNWSSPIRLDRHKYWLPPPDVLESVPVIYPLYTVGCPDGHVLLPHRVYTEPTAPRTRQCAHVISM